MRSIYLYGMCAVSIALIAVGALAMAVSGFRMAAPDAGHRDNIDRISVGLANIADKAIEHLESDPKSAVPSADTFCKDYAGTPEQCKADYESMYPPGSDVLGLPSSVAAIIGDVRDWEFGSPPCGARKGTK